MVQGKLKMTWNKKKNTYSRGFIPLVVTKYEYAKLQHAIEMKIQYAKALKENPLLIL